MIDSAEISSQIQNGVAVISGAGTGLGRALALELASRGMQVAGLGRRQGPLEEVAATEQAGRFTPYIVDIADAEALALVFADIHRDLGQPGLLINNAAIYPHRDILDETADSFMQTIGINLGGAFNCCHSVLPGMVDRGYGRIINIGSFADIRPAPLSAGYSVSKGAVRILTRSLVADLGDRFPDIIINDWMPGVLNTEMGLPDGIDPKDAAVWGANLALWHARDLNGVTFDRNQEKMPLVSFKRRIFNRVTGRRAVPRSLD